MTALLEPLDKDARWTQREARHLLNRAGFGVPMSALPALVSAGPEGAVELMVAYERHPDNIEQPDFLTPEDATGTRMMMSMVEDDDERRRLQQERQRQQRQEVERLRGWWLDQMRRTNRPLQEKMTLFWHGHFATSAEKVRQPTWNHELNQVFRTHATGNFRTMVFAVGQTPAMLRYLDNNQNRKGSPNENWARELMELFTMGIGNYTEADIKEAARAFTGYTERNGQFTFVENQHDFGEKTFLGRKGELDGADIIDIIFEQPETARFIARKLWEYFVYENPSDDLVEQLADGFRRSDYELKPLLRAIFRSREFYGERAMAGQIKSPVQYVVMMQDQLQHEPERDLLTRIVLRGLGQDLFAPPNVKGWPGNRAWINTHTLMIRYNIPAYALLGEIPNRSNELRLDETERDAIRSGQAPGTNRQRILERTRERRRREATDKLVKIFETLDGRPPLEVANAIAWHFLGRSLDERQQAVLVRSLMQGNDLSPVFRFTGSGHDRAIVTTHLVMCMAEYQLC